MSKLSLAGKALRMYRERGFVALFHESVDYLSWLRRHRLPEFLQQTYVERVRGHLPTIGYVLYNGVAVARPRTLLDPVVPRHWIGAGVGTDIPLYENALVVALREHVRESDRVVIIGGGYGVTVVTAARLVGRQGSVTCYEAVSERLRDIDAAVDLNRIDIPVRLEHAIVARAVSLLGDGSDAAVVPPEQIPPCDVLEMDCEGAEIEIMKGLAFRPRVILVETHGMLGTPTSEVRRVLEEMGYSVEDAGVAEPTPENELFCLENDIRVLVACTRPAEQSPESADRIAEGGKEVLPAGPSGPPV
jgi:hypothetical protein